MPAGIKVPPSLRNIKKELQRDLGVPVTQQGSLLSWAHQGVLLLNAILTVRGGEAASHRSLGWEMLTDSIIQAVSETAPHAVFMLWGNFAQGKRALIDEEKHLVLCANHPSPLSALRPPVPFIGCGHFGAANTWRRMASSLSIGRSDPCPAEFGRAFDFQGAGLGKRIDGNLDFGASQQVLAEVVYVQG